jgi:hypothetical protein
MCGKNFRTLSIGGWLGPGDLNGRFERKHLLTPAGFQTPDLPDLCAFPIQTTLHRFLDFWSKRINIRDLFVKEKRLFNPWNINIRKTYELLR